MIIDQTRYDAFWRNPEKYRLTYELNLVPKSMAYGLSRGTAFHLIQEELSKGRDRDTIDRILRGEVEGSRGPLSEPLDAKSIAMAWNLADELERQYPRSDGRIVTIAAEVEFCIPIPGSPHFMAGRIDEILAREGEICVGELKTANSRASYDRWIEDWRTKKQADFVLLGAQSLGYPAQYVWVRQVVEGTPPKVWELTERRTSHQLAVTQLNVHQTCEIIQMLKTCFGIEQPWPHLSFSWPCCKAESCEYQGICCQPLDQLTTIDLASFKQREEHLDCVKRALMEQRV